MFKKTNPNPANNLVGDCVIRAISILTNEDWEYTFLELCIFAFSMHDMPSSNAVWGAYLIDLGYKRYVIPNVCPACFTIRQFCKTHPNGKYLLATGTHVVTVIDGDYYDTWDSGDEVPVYYFTKEEIVNEL